jgi:hypothetical protein
LNHRSFLLSFRSDGRKRFNTLRRNYRRCGWLGLRLGNYRRCWRWQWGARDYRHAPSPRTQKVCSPYFAFERIMVNRYREKFLLDTVHLDLLQPGNPDCGRLPRLDLVEQCGYLFQLFTFAMV